MLVYMINADGTVWFVLASDYSGWLAVGYSGREIGEYRRFTVFDPRVLVDVGPVRGRSHGVMYPLYGEDNIYGVFPPGTDFRQVPQPEPALTIAGHDLYEEISTRKLRTSVIIVA